MVDRQLFEYHVNLHNPSAVNPTQETVEFFTYWSPVKRTMLEIAESCAAQETILSGLKAATKGSERYIPTGPAELQSDYLFPPDPVELEELSEK